MTKEEERRKKKREYYHKIKNTFKVIKAEVKPETREKLDKIIQKENKTIVQWITEKIEEDYKKL